jgi:hypothetical protein
VKAGDPGTGTVPGHLGEKELRLGHEYQIEQSKHGAIDFLLVQLHDECYISPRPHLLTESNLSTTVGDRAKNEKAAPV